MVVVVTEVVVVEDGSPLTTEAKEMRPRRMILKLGESILRRAEGDERVLLSLGE